MILETKNLGILIFTKALQTFYFPCLSERISLFKLFEIGFLVVFGDLEGLFCAENEKFPV